MAKVRYGKPRLFEADKQSPWATYTELLAMDGLDAVLVCTPNATHRDYAVRALAAGKHVLLEKPMETTLAKCNDILDAARAGGRVLQIGMICRHIEFYRNLRRAIETPGFEPGYMLVEEVRGPFASAWKYDARMSGGLLVEKSCHTFDLFNWLSRKRPVKVVALGGCDVIQTGAVGDILGNVTEISGTSSIYDNAHVAIEYENRLRASYHICFFRDQKYGITHPIRVVGRNKEEVRGELFERRLYFTDGLAKAMGCPKGYLEMEYGLFSLAEAGVEQVRSFYETVVNGAPNAAPGEEGKLAIAVSLAAQQSIDKGGQPVTLAEMPGLSRR
jgi:predicted dehydrogenase